MRRGRVSGLLARSGRVVRRGTALAMGAVSAVTVWAGVQVGLARTTLLPSGVARPGTLLDGADSLQPGGLPGVPWTPPAPGEVAVQAPAGAVVVEGPAVDTKWGPVQVQVAVVDGVIMDVDAIQTPDAHDRGVLIAQRAVPLLNREVIAVQSAAIESVTGATVTSEGYERSLQAALDQLGQ